MAGLLGRVREDGEDARVGASGVRVGELAGRLGRGEPAAAVASSLGLETLDVLAALAWLGLGPAGSEGPPLIQGRPTQPELAAALADEPLAGLLPRSPRPRRLAVAAGFLQVLDCWDASHHAAQEADDLGEPSFAAYWHGIAHRREPDPGNAAFWFRRVGTHPAFTPLAVAARPLLEEHGDPALVARLLPGGRWDPFAFIDLTRSARGAQPVATLARRLQRLEMSLLLDATLVAPG